MAEADILRFGDFRVDLRDERLWRGPTAIPLPPKAFALLRCLLTNPRKLVTKMALLEAVWPDSVVGDAVLKVGIGELRRALGDDRRAPRFIETVHRRGYRFLAAVGPTSAARPSTKIPSLGHATVNADDADESRAAGHRLVGREAEIRALGVCLEKALRGDRQLVFLTGEPGIGKTALVTAFLAHVTSRCACWIGEGQCIEHFGSGEAYLPVFAALHHLSGAPGGVRLRKVLEQHAPSWLAQIPALLDAATLETLALRTQGATRERMMREMAEAAEALAEEQPMIVVLEDLHWGDAATVELLSFLARRRAPARLLVLGTYRPTDAAGNEHVVVPQRTSWPFTDSAWSCHSHDSAKRASANTWPRRCLGTGFRTVW
jgi:DNA-binding winged helix-turn-helix (wHTH) protein